MYGSYILEQRKCGDYVTKKLTLKQQKFVDAFIETGNATEAARLAGYTGKPNVIGPRMLANVSISRAIEKRQKEIKSQKTADITEVMEFLTATMRGEVDEDSINPVTGVHDRLGVSVKVRVDAAKELVKRYPTKLLDEEQRLKLEKLKAEVDNIKTSTEAIKVEIVDDIPCD